jgi:hypothetical protein
MDLDELAAVTTRNAQRRLGLAPLVGALPAG